MCLPRNCNWFLKEPQGLSDEALQARGTRGLNPNPYKWGLPKVRGPGIPMRKTIVLGDIYIYTHIICGRLTFDSKMKSG